MIKAITFDLEGTIINTEAFHRQAWINTAHHFGIANFDPIPDFIGAGDKIVSTHLARLAPASPDEIYSHKKSLHLAALTNATIKPRPGWLKLYRDIEQLNLPMAIGTVTPADEVDILINQTPLKSLFDSALIVLCQDGIKAKPAPDVYLETAQRLNVEPRHQLVFEDSLTGIKAATSAGSPTIATPIFYKQTKHLFTDAIAVVQDWHQAHNETFKLLQP